jgi:hypothetical protein
VIKSKKKPNTQKAKRVTKATLGKEKALNNNSYVPTSDVKGDIIDKKITF